MKHDTRGHTILQRSAPAHSPDRCNASATPPTASACDLCPPRQWTLIS